MKKLDDLIQLLESYGTYAIGFSGGVDSTFLAAVSARFMSKRARLIHVDSPFITTPERTSCAQEAAGLGLPLHIVTVNPLDDCTVAANPPDRCYHCKRLIFAAVIDAARSQGIRTVLDGSNADDALDFRPGMRALTELGVCSPLMETGWHKEEERALLREWGHAVWSMPAGACLATRIACGERISASKLELIQACENFFHARGIENVRARLSCGHVRIEADAAEIERAQAFLPVLRTQVDASIDPQVIPYRHGATSTVSR